MRVYGGFIESMGRLFPRPGEEDVNAPPKMTLKPGMIVLVPSDGGYAPDATEPELCFINPPPAQLADRGLIQIEGLITDRAEFIENEVYSDAIRIVDVKMLTSFLDSLTMPEYAARRKDAASLLQNPEAGLFVNHYPSPVSRAPEEGMETEAEESFFEPPWSEWLPASKISFVLATIALTFSITALIVSAAS